jgi:protein involved in polysaccharide export with SLBB domain
MGMRAPVDRAFQRPDLPISPAVEVECRYRLSCPDIIELTIDGQPLTGVARQRIGPDGRIRLGALGQPRIEGQTTAEAATAVASLVGASPDRVSVRVVGYESQKVYVFGAVHGLQRAVPFHGEETVVDLLHRLGGITAGAEPGSVYVIRPHIASGGRPEIFTVDLRAIVMKHDSRTNLRLAPGDQVYISETPRARYAKCIPPLLRPIYDAVCGMHRPEDRGVEATE